MKKVLFIFIMVALFLPTLSKGLPEEALDDIREIINEYDEDIQEEPAKMNISFYPMGLFLETYILGLEIPTSDKTAFELKYGHYKVFDERLFDRYELRYRKYSKSGLRKGYAGVFGGYLDYNEGLDKDDDDYVEVDNGGYVGLEFGYKMRFVDDFYMSNGINFGYSQASGGLYNEDTGMFFGIDLVKLHFAF